MSPIPENAAGGSISAASRLKLAPFKLALLSSLLCWFAFPPIDWPAVAWFAPIGWLLLVGREQLQGRRPYRAMWLAGMIFWLLTLHWIRLPHPVNYVAWLVLASYLGAYLPVFVALSRVGVHRLRLPLGLVAPVVWTGLDWVRGHLMTGFLMGSLAHTQADSLNVIQIASFVGEYGVTFLIMLVAACLTQSLLQKPPRRYVPILSVACVLSVVLFYGYTHRADSDVRQASLGPRIALIQGNTLADWKNDPDKQLHIMQEHARLSQEAIRESQHRDGRKVDLLIWPETAYRYPLFDVASNYQPPADRFPDSHLNAAQIDLAEFVRRTESAILTGIDRIALFPNKQGEPDYQQFNSSVLVDKQGMVVGTYDKMHLVIMGEYVPLTNWFPVLKRLTPITGLASAGEQPRALVLNEWVYCPNICYETAVPHLIRHQVKSLADAGAAPDVLVNLTNDAWFWGSSELDLHLACGIFRAIEMRRPLLIAANGGLSAAVDPDGKVRHVTRRQVATTLLFDLPERVFSGLSFYARWGDWFAGACMLCCVVLAAVGWRSQRQVKLP